MPSKFIVRDFIENGTYHVYNDTVEKKLFLDDQDYRVFLFYLFVYSSPKDAVKGKYPDLPFRLKEKNLHKEIRIISYCLMPDHYHLIVRQLTKDAIQRLMKQIINGYTLYFNQKYKRKGGVFRGRYKAARIKTDDNVIQMWRYVHLNPVIEGRSNHPVEYKWSSYDYFMGGDGSEIRCDRELVDSFFRSTIEIEKFHTDKNDFIAKSSLIKELIIEKE